jgi:hypothetical protein
MYFRNQTLPGQDFLSYSGHESLLDSVIFHRWIEVKDFFRIGRAGNPPGKSEAPFLAERGFRRIPLDVFLGHAARIAPHYDVHF